MRNLCQPVFLSIDRFLSCVNTSTKFFHLIVKLWGIMVRYQTPWLNKSCSGNNIWWITHEWKQSFFHVPRTFLFQWCTDNLLPSLPRQASNVKQAQYERHNTLFWRHTFLRLIDIHVTFFCIHNHVHCTFGYTKRYDMVTYFMISLSISQISGMKWLTIYNLLLLINSQIYLPKTQNISTYWYNDNKKQCVIHKIKLPNVSIANRPVDFVALQ